MDQIPKIKTETPLKSTRRQRADAIKNFQCKHLIAVLENPSNIKNIASVIRNVNGLGIEKVYVVDPNHLFPDNWQELRKRGDLNKLSVSASKWSYVKRFDSTQACFDHLDSIRYHSIVTSPHVKGKASIFVHEGDFTTFPKLAVWFGNERQGISDEAVKHADMCVAIPMFGMIESLNLGTSSGIILYEIARQRRNYQSQYRHRGRKGKRETPLPIVMATEPQAQRET